MIGICVHFIFLQYTSNGLDIEWHVCVSIVYVCWALKGGLGQVEQGGPAGPSRAGQAGPSRAGRAGPSRAVEPTAQGSPPPPPSPPPCMDTGPSLLERELLCMDKMPYTMLKSTEKSCMVLDPSHVKQLSLIHVCKIGLR
jgi:hypothetical protein